MANAQLSSKAVGSIVKLKVNGTAKEFIVVHQGKPSSLYDESCNGVWLLMKDIYENRQWHSSDVNKLESSTIHSYLNTTFLNLFDSNIKDAIKQVKIPYRANGGQGGTDQSGANGLPAKVFLLSGYEVGWTTSNSRYFPVDGAKLDYFESGGGTSANNKRVAKLNGTDTGWWLRSPYTNNTTVVWRVYPNGSRDYLNASNSYGVRPALVLPSNLLVDDSGNVTIPDLTAHKTLVNGTAYTVKSGKCMVDGTVYNILKGRTLIDGTGYDITFKPSYDPVFANNTWEQIIEACHNNEVPETWKVADQKPMTINGVDYQIDIIGKNHDDYSDGSGKAPLTFQLHDFYGEQKNMNGADTNTVGWTSCAMRRVHLPTILSKMPVEVQNGIRDVNKETSPGNTSNNINTTADKLFLLSEKEVFGTSGYTAYNEGHQYEYYKDSNKTNKSGAFWWLRSPYISNAKDFCLVDYKGQLYHEFASTAFKVSFAFCF